MEEVKVIDKYKCDSCGKVQDEMESLLTGHNDWGNDSIDSMETLHFCSSGCYYDLLVFEIWKNRMSRTAYFDETLLSRWEYVLKENKNREGS
jgi:catechol-2,3-dioxygenase